MNETYLWYQQLVKPAWAPPNWLFGPVWTVLYIIIAVSFGAVFYAAIKKRAPASIAVPFLLNLVFNAAFTTIQFGLKNNPLAAIDVLLVFGTIIWSLAAVYPRRRLRWVAYVNIPYLVWVTFASILQISITFLNR